MAQAAVEQVILAALGGGIFVSPVSAWEVGLLARPGRSRLAFAPDPRTWFEDFLGRPGIRVATLSVQIAIAASMLPNPPHADPADRLLIATARDLDMPLVTSDRKIISYAAAGHVAVIAC